MINKILALLLLTLFVVVANPSAAGDLEDGIAAYKRQDFATAMRLLSPLAKQDNTDAQLFVGWMYYEGEGVPQNFRQAFINLRPAAEKGNDIAQYILGTMYADGKHVEQNYAEASRWYRSAAIRKNADAQNELGLLYLRGEGVRQDDDEAEKWFKLAIEGGHKKAHLNLGLIPIRKSAQAAMAQQAQQAQAAAAAQTPPLTPPNIEPFKANVFLLGQVIGCLLRFDLYQRLGKAKSPSYELVTGNTANSLKELFAIADSQRAQFYGTMDRNAYMQMIERVAASEVDNGTAWLQSMGCYKMLKAHGLVQ